MKELTDWLADPVPGRFPYSAVTDEFHGVGKHFVSDGTLKSLALARERLAEQATGATDAERLLLARFLDTALDKWDGVYDYPSYTSLSVLGLPTADDGPAAADAARTTRDRLTVQLLADLLRFELDAAAGRTAWLPQMRPDARLVEKRCRLAVRVASPALARLGYEGRLTADDPAGQAAQLWEFADGELLDPHERRVLKLSIMPVYVSHDEHMFIRVLQTFETTFALLALSIRTAIGHLDAARTREAADHLAVAETVLAESAPLFSLLATMQVESFRTFRDFTEGASAIQSRNYKLVESLCRVPDQDRLDSPAYRSTPEVRERILAGQPTLDEACAAARTDARFTAADHELLTAAMLGFAGALRRWRQTHYRLAVRMLGARSGTGATEGTPYLSAVRTIPVFRSVTEAPDAPEAPAVAEAKEATAPTCPMGSTAASVTPTPTCPMGSSRPSGSAAHPESEKAA
ncbi:tryptophan 2,3-dioxygenase [Streptomyces sp. SP17BM10]|uniref:tryptophan 2,3-dioxygenase n=1 Tax=Streptomyces sp. SP17BM10 TaxID=3002530 RepID=UPI002E760D46|nr:tryptophan 2,3-dioxygenase [Streptomyces sp. SP17BM10]MEE1783421.1 tryptophan 2,3-dioxygenase [Streptomyces sp. SP17BM10]